MISSPLLTTIPDLIHSFGTRDDTHLPKGLVTSKQVHGTEILFVKDTGKKEYEGFDALMTDRPGVAVAIRTADCLPILIADPVRRLVAAVHAGWKGTLKRVVEVAIRRMKEGGSRPEGLAVAMGPCLGRCCCEVGGDVTGPFQKEFANWPDFLRAKGETKWLLDLQACNRLQLLSMGILPERIDQIDLCTHCRPDLFYSVRREGENVGRMISFIQRL